MQSNKAKKTKLKQIESLCRKSNFTIEEVEALMQNYATSCIGGSMDEVTFKGEIHKLLGITEEVILERMFKVFDTVGDNVVSLEEWVTGLSTILRGDLNICFRVYDLTNGQYITRDDILFLLKDSVLQVEDNEDVEEHVKNIVEITIKKMDYDKDGRLSFMDFSKAVDNDRVVLEAFGACLPKCKINLINGRNSAMTP